MFDYVLHILGSFDIRVLDYVSSTLIQFVPFFKVVTMMSGGVGAIVWIVVGSALLWFFVSAERAWLYGSVIVAAGSFSYFFKYVFGRLRPLGQLVYESSFSLPSGHATASAAIAMSVILWAVYDVRLSRWVRYAVIITAIFFALLVGISRLVLRVHYPTDVLAGWCLGVLCAFSGERVISFLNKRKQGVL
jgi:undecaprenyl-diphosphatase